jgi:restriction system protein
MVCAVNQAAYLLKRQLESQGGEFLESGGFTEKLYGARKRGKVSDESDKSDRSDSANCPQCGQPMKVRTARTGAKRGQQFWGCSAYPGCKGTLPLVT